MKVLVVDDSKAIFMMVSQMLEEAEHKAVWAEDGRRAFECIAEHGDIDLILLDWNMPNMNGPEFLKKNMEDGIFKNPIIMMTTENKPDYIKRALELGAVEYIMKPFTSDILFNKMELVLDA
ncbi:chemotaxis protein CheY-like protein [Bacteriovorax sp. BSW11_IV]|uniref:response regulator n=1 Tax=Bacteriovorax sp. BSW11_IV TaxID=1353529 RepID=UPI000389DCB9|nr:response regulator [Bacteriovorax sp. BSW11_IV]EQC49574.1 chemotaxis protein CheY-like protein [Bacteriovorax sp. BSW11_IV]